jgi:hypothetical protein
LPRPMSGTREQRSAACDNSSVLDEMAIGMGLVGREYLHLEPSPLQAGAVRKVLPAGECRIEGRPGSAPGHCAGERIGDLANQGYRHHRSRLIKGNAVTA